MPGRGGGPHSGGDRGLRNSDAYHITSPAEDGAGAAYAMCQAIRDAGITPEM